MRALTHRIGNCASRLGACLVTEPRMVAELTLWRWSLPILKRLLRVETLAALMTPRVTEAPSATRRRGRTAAVHRVVTTGGRLLVSPNCLERSLVTFRLFARAGASVTLVLGVRHDGSTVDGHSWIELDGRSLDTPKSDDYTPMVTFRARGSVDGIDRVAAGALPPS